MRGSEYLKIVEIEPTAKMPHTKLLMSLINVYDQFGLNQIKKYTETKPFFSPSNSTHKTKVNSLIDKIKTNRTKKPLLNAAKIKHTLCDLCHIRVCINKKHK